MENQWFSWEKSFSTYPRNINKNRWLLQIIADTCVRFFASMKSYVYCWQFTYLVDFQLNFNEIQKQPKNVSNETQQKQGENLACFCLKKIFQTSNQYHNLRTYLKPNQVDSLRAKL